MKLVVTSCYILYLFYSIGTPVELESIKYKYNRHSSEILMECPELKM